MEIRREYAEGANGLAVAAAFARKLERELAAANDRANNAEQAARNWNEVAHLEVHRCDALIVERAELLKDKARLDWLQATYEADGVSLFGDQGEGWEIRVGDYSPFHLGESLREAIDFFREHPSK